MRWLRETLNFKPSLVENCRSPAVLCTYSILHLLGCSSCQIHRTSALHIYLSLSPWGQLDSPWPLNLQTRLTHLPLHQEKSSNKLLWTSSWTCWSDHSQEKHEIPKSFFWVPNLCIPQQYWSFDYQIQTKPKPVTEDSSVLTAGVRLCQLWDMIRTFQKWFKWTTSTECNIIKVSTSSCVLPFKRPSISGTLETVRVL